MNMAFGKLIFSVIYLLLFLTNGRSQSLKLVDSESQIPLIGASVLVDQGQLGVVTDELGMARLDQFSAYDSIYISYIGYQPITIANHFDPDQTTIIRLQSGILSEEIIVIDRAPNQNRTELPAHIETLKADAIKSSHPQTTADFVSQANGVFLQKSQLGGGSPLIRGFAANRILLVVDGVRMNNAIFRSGNLQNIISIDPNGLDQVNVLLGPNSLKYGSDALGGVISMQTKKPAFTNGWRGRVSAQYHSANQEKTAALTLNYSNEKWAWRGNVGYSNFSNLTMGSHGPDSYLRDSIQVSTVTNNIISDQTLLHSNPKKQIHTGYNQFFTQQQINYKINLNSILKYSFYYSRSTEIPRYDRLIEKRNGSFRHAEWYYGPQKWMMHKVNYTTHTPHKIFDFLQINLASQQYEESRHDRRYQHVNLRNREEGLDIYNFNLDAVKSIGKFKISYGTEWTYNKVESRAYALNIITNTESLIQTRYPSGSTMQSLAFYIQSGLSLSDRLNLSGGLRYTQTSIDAPISNEFIQLPFSEISLSTPNVSGSLGLSYIPSTDLYMYANISSGFRSPNIDDVGKVFDSEPGNVVVPNDNLRPEKVYSGEIGLESRYKTGINYHFGMYYIYLNDIISRQDFSFNGQDSIVYDGTLSKVQSLQNADYGYIYGIEGKINYSFQKYWSVLLQGSYQKGFEIISDESQPLRHIAPLFGTFKIKYKRNNYTIISSLTFNDQVKYNQLAETERSKSHLYATNDQGQPYSPSWWAWNLNTEWRRGKLTLNAGIENILDKRYRPYSSGIVNAGRSGVLAVSYEL